MKIEKKGKKLVAFRCKSNLLWKKGRNKKRANFGKRGKNSCAFSLLSPFSFSGVLIFLPLLVPPLIILSFSTLLSLLSFLFCSLGNFSTFFCPFFDCIPSPFS